MFVLKSSERFTRLNFIMLSALSFFVLFTSTLSYAQAKTGNLIIKVDNIKNNNGKIRVSVFNSSNGFPNITENAIILAEGDISKKSARIEIENIPLGEYAISLIHDENENKKLETNFMGIPREGFGISNNAKGTFGPPKYDQAKFMFLRNKQIIHIKMSYY